MDQTHHAPSQNKKASLFASTQPARLFKQPQKGSLSYYLLFFFILLFPLSSLAQYQAGNTYMGTQDYIEYHAGDLPIIISAPHGGYLEPASIPDRSCGNCVTGRDSRTEELAYEIDSAVQMVFGGYPHVIINKLARVKLDANREIVEAALGNPEAELAWQEYHAFIQAAKDSCVARYGSAIFIDLHGHGHPIQRIELGYLLSKATLQLSDSTLNAMNLQNSCSIRHLKNELNPAVPFGEILRGNHCMGELLARRGFPSVPSASDPAPLPNDPYWTGGYNTRRHGSRDSSQINAIQFETNWTGIRNTNANRNAFAQALACTLRSYLDQWYFGLDRWDPGHQVSSTADAGPGSLRSALLGAEDGTIITFAPSIYGDTIRLQKELQICGRVILQGPGADLLAISGMDTSRILRIMQGSEVEISGLSLTQGYATNEDGGALLAHGQIRLSNCTLTNNYAVDDGGAISLADSMAFVRLDSCLVTNNRCGSVGGGLHCVGGNLVIHASTINHNVSASSGGGLFTSGVVSVSSSTFSDNEALSSGGGIRNLDGGQLTCVNSTFARNSCSNRGGGISTSSIANLNFCTIIENMADDLGGGIRVPTGGSCMIQNSLVANNTGSSGHDVSMFSGAFISNGNNFIGDTTGSSWIAAPADLLGNTTTPLAPLALPLAANGGITETVALQAASPCIDRANANGAPALDQRGRQRISGPQPDIGAYEACTPSAGTDVQIACDRFTWIDGQTYTSSNDSASFMLINAGGCDSVVSLNLTIIQLDTTVAITDSALIANLSGASYQWLDCDNGSTALAGETNQNFIPSENGNYAVEIRQNACVDTSACYLFTTVGIVENDFGKGLLVYPNPTANHLTIDLGQSHRLVQVKTINSAGQLIQSTTFSNSQKLGLEIEGASGYYLIKIIADENKEALIRVLKK